MNDVDEIIAELEGGKQVVQRERGENFLVFWLHAGSIDYLESLGFNEVLPEQCLADIPDCLGRLMRTVTEEKTLIGWLTSKSCPLAQA